MIAQKTDGVLGVPLQDSLQNIKVITAGGMKDLRLMFCALRLEKNHKRHYLFERLEIFVGGCPVECAMISVEQNEYRKPVRRKQLEKFHLVLVLRILSEP